MQNKTVCLSIHKDILKDSFKNTFVSYKKNILIISYKINDDILTSLMMWVKFDFEVNPSDSIYEILTFNFFNGAINLLLKINNKIVTKLKVKKISIFDIYDPLYYLIENDSITKDKIFKCLKENNYSSFISSKELINFKNLAIITKFIGYKKDFYYSIPYNLQNKETIFINTSFIKIAKKMQNFKYVFEIYNNSKLPNINSLKNTMFKNPALFFYLNEIEMLYKLFNDSNILNQILIHNDIFRILAYLHEYKNLYYFLRMLKDIRGKTWLYTMLLKYDVRMFDDGINYYSMSTYRKELEMKMWKTKNEPNYSFVESTYKPTFSIPINHKNINIKFNYINNWYFKPIKCELKRINLFSLINDNNLLIDFQNIPYGVFDNNNQAIAYIEIDKDIVSYCNVRKEHLERFDPIFYKWTTKNHLNTNYLHYK